MLAEGNAVGSIVRKIRPVRAIQFSADDFVGFAPSGRIHLLDTFPRALPPAKMVQALGLMGPLPLNAKHPRRVDARFNCRNTTAEILLVLKEAESYHWSPSLRVEAVVYANTRCLRGRCAHHR